jgi:hypothetical protein
MSGTCWTAGGCDQHTRCTRHTIHAGYTRTHLRQRFVRGMLQQRRHRRRHLLPARRADRVEVRAQQRLRQLRLALGRRLKRRERQRRQLQRRRRRRRGRRRLMGVAGLVVRVAGGRREGAACAACGACVWWCVCCVSGQSLERKKLLHAPNKAGAPDSVRRCLLPFPCDETKTNNRRANPPSSSQAAEFIAAILIRLFNGCISCRGASPCCLCCFCCCCSFFSRRCCCCIACSSCAWYRCSMSPSWGAACCCCWWDRAASARDPPCDGGCDGHRPLPSGPSAAAAAVAPPPPLSRGTGRAAAAAPSPSPSSAGSGVPTFPRTKCNSPCIWSSASSCCSGSSPPRCCRCERGGEGGRPDTGVGAPLPFSRDGCCCGLRSSSPPPPPLATDPPPPVAPAEPAGPERCSGST